MPQVEQHIQEIKKVNPRLTDNECLIIHCFMEDVAYALQNSNGAHFSLPMFKGILEEHFPEYSYGTSNIVDFKPPHNKLNAILIEKEGIEFNMFVDNEIKIIVFREENPYKHIFEIAISQYLI